MNAARISTPFGPASTAAEVIAGVDLTGRRAVVTGASSGIGQETARVLAGAGAEVTLAVRDIAAGQRAAAEIAARRRRERPGGPARPGRPGLGRRVHRGLAGAAAHPGQQRRHHGRPRAAHAGRLGTAVRDQPPWSLRPSERAAQRASERAAQRPAAPRVVSSVSSVGHVNGEVLFDDVNFERHPYDPWAAYSQSKTANVLFAVEAARRWAADGIAVNALNPGRIASTGLSRHIDPAALAPSRSIRRAAPASRSRTYRRAPRLRSCWPPRRWSRGSPAGTSRTARRRRRTWRASGAASPPTRWTRSRPPGSGNCPWTCLPPN